MLNKSASVGQVFLDVLLWLTNWSFSPDHANKNQLFDVKQLVVKINTLK